MIPRKTGRRKRRSALADEDEERHIALPLEPAQRAESGAGCSAADLEPAEANPQAQRGYSRDHRPDCKRVLITLVVTFDGIPLGCEVFAGNTHDARTMEARHGMLGREWITDRGMASAENLAWLRQTGRRYIIGAPTSELKRTGVIAEP
jgi:transposase